MYTTAQTVRNTYAEKVPEAVLTCKKRETPPVSAKVKEEVETHITAFACRDPPEEYSKQTLRLPADRSVDWNTSIPYLI